VDGTRLWVAGPFSNQNLNNGKNSTKHALSVQKRWDSLVDPPMEGAFDLMDFA